MLSVARTFVRKGKGVKTGAENEPLTLPRKNCTRSASCTAARISSHPHRRARGEALAIRGHDTLYGKNKFYTHVAMKAAPTSVRERVERLHCCLCLRQAPCSPLCKSMERRSCSCFLNSAEAVPFVAILTSICFFKLAAPFLRPTVFLPLPLAADPFSQSLYIYIIQFSVFPLSRFSTLCDIRPSCVWGQPLYQRAIIRIAPASKF